ncbi:MAG TPA: TQO small subunit DoxD [Ktedonobacteraceae bacterium]|nr:TQO small subunit DoxD [Ktedonobacteraceae bacterium]
MRPTQGMPPSRVQTAASPSRQTNNTPNDIYPKTSRRTGWILSPMRLFLGITFVYAGIQKFTDPQFFHKATPGYIGNQIIGFAHGSPLHNILIHLVLSHAMQFGYLIALGEIAIGLGTLCGLLFRPAAFFGLLLSFTFFLTASWHVYPYFYGADIVFVFCWLTMLLNGPTATGYPALDNLLVEPVFPPGVTGIRGLLRALLTGKPDAPGTRVAEEAGNARAGSRQQRGWSVAQRKQETRRSFIAGAMFGIAGSLALGAVGIVLNSLANSSNSATTTTTTQQPAAPAPTSAGNSSTTTSTGAGQGGNTIAQVSKVAKNDSVTFNIPTTGDPGVLIHLPNDQFVAYDATCTHAGCQVAYDAPSQHLVCPCHGATFDPAQNAAVLAGPAPTPLTKVAIHVDSATGAITLQ